MYIGEGLEYASFHALANDDVPAFARTFLQLRPYYSDYASLLPSSERRAILVGLYLLYLLAHNEIMNFHMEYELLVHEGEHGHGDASSAFPNSPSHHSTSSPILSSHYLKFPIQLEQQLIEGSYEQIFNQSKTYPMWLYGKFMNILLTTVR